MFNSGIKFFTMITDNTATQFADIARFALSFLCRLDIIALVGWI